MTRVLVTGGTGVLGREVVSRLLAKGYTVRIMSRSPRRAKTDVEMTRQLLDKAKAAGVGYFLYISIVGIDKTSFSYHKVKVACEKLARDSGIPYASLRLTQFYEFIDLLMHMFTRLPIGFVPMDWQSQPIDAGEAADQVVRVVAERPLGLLPDVAGPEVLTFKEMVREWQQERGSYKLVLPLPLPGELSAAARKGLLTAPNARVGKFTWAQWLDRRYGHARQTGEKI